MVLVHLFFMIIITGSVAYDYIMEFPGKFGDHILPDSTHNINLSFIVNKFAKRRGGTAGNVSYSLGLLNTPHILYSYVGKDFYEYKKAFESYGIDTSYLRIDSSTYTATGFAMTDLSENQIWGFFYGAMDKNPHLKLSKIAKKDDLVLIGPQGAKGSLSFVRQCKQLKIPYMFDPGFILTQVSNKDLEMGLKNAAYIIGNEYEEKLMKDRIKKFDEIIKTKIFIKTIGPKGAIIKTPKEEIAISPIKLKKVAETTGAGDAFRAGFIAGLSRGFNLKTCGQMGALAGSYAVGHYGTQEHTYTKKEFQDKYRQNYKDLLKL